MKVALQLDFLVAMIACNSQMYVFNTLNAIKWVATIAFNVMLHIQESPHGWTYHQEIHATECASYLHSPLSCKPWNERVESVMALYVDHHLSNMGWY